MKSATAILASHQSIGSVKKGLREPTMRTRSLHEIPLVCLTPLTSDRMLWQRMEVIVTATRRFTKTTKGVCSRRHAPRLPLLAGHYEDSTRSRTVTSGMHPHPICLRLLQCRCRVSPEASTRQCQPPTNQALTVPDLATDSRPLSIPLQAQDKDRKTHDRFKWCNRTLMTALRGRCRRHKRDRIKEFHQECNHHSSQCTTSEHRFSVTLSRHIVEHQLARHYLQLLITIRSVVIYRQAHAKAPHQTSMALPRTITVLKDNFQGSLRLNSPFVVTRRTFRGVIHQLSRRKSMSDSAVTPTMRTTYSGLIFPQCSLRKPPSCIKTRLISFSGASSRQM